MSGLVFSSTGLDIIIPFPFPSLTCLLRPGIQMDHSGISSESSAHPDIRINQCRLVPHALAWNHGTVGTISAEGTLFDWQEFAGVFSRIFGLGHLFWQSSFSWTAFWLRRTCTPPPPPPPLEFHPHNLRTILFFTDDRLAAERHPRDGNNPVGATRGFNVTPVLGPHAVYPHLNSWKTFFT